MKLEEIPSQVCCKDAFEINSCDNGVWIYGWFCKNCNLDYIVVTVDENSSDNLENKEQNVYL